VFENRKNGKKAVVIANQGETDALNAKVSLDSGNHCFDVYHVDTDETEISDGSIVIKPRCLVVLVEK
jgi:hypothetical protein